MGWLHKLWQSICTTLLYALIIVVLLQVLTRYLSQFSLFSWVPLLPWTEEMSRFLFVAMVNLGMILVMKENGFVRLEFIAEILSQKTGKQGHKIALLYFLALQSILFVFFVLFCIGAYHFVLVGFRSNSPSLQLPFGIIFSFVLLMSLFCCGEIIASIVREAKKLGAGQV